MVTRKREYWSEEDVDALPQGEHDYFDRKSGALFNDLGEFLATVGKAVSAFANSGGGSLVLGVQDDGTPDGMPLVHGRTPFREWLEQQLPHLVDYPLSDFRVHEVTAASQSRIPAGKCVIVVDIGDSPLAPHQCTRGGRGIAKHMYYYRQGGHSEPAPHFNLELLRQRLVNPVLTVPNITMRPTELVRAEDRVFLRFQVTFAIRNDGRVAAYKWGLRLNSMGGHAEKKVADYVFERSNFPANTDRSSSIPLDTTILPGFTYTERRDFGVYLPPQTITNFKALEYEYGRMLGNLSLTYYIATETSPGEERTMRLQDVLKRETVFEFVASKADTL